jgi:hypothetical protein
MLTKIRKIINILLLPCSIIHCIYHDEEKLYILINLKHTGWKYTCELDSTGSIYGSEAGSCEHGNEPSGFIKDREFRG